MKRSIHITLSTVILKKIKVCFTTFMLITCLFICISIIFHMGESRNILPHIKQLKPDGLFRLVFGFSMVYFVFLFLINLAILYHTLQGTAPLGFNSHRITDKYRKCCEYSDVVNLYRSTVFNQVTRNYNNWGSGLKHFCSRFFVLYIYFKEKIERCLGHCA